jgi:hypothetical protein
MQAALPHADGSWPAARKCIGVKGLTEAVLPPSDRRDSLEGGRSEGATARLGDADLDTALVVALETGSPGVEDLDIVASLARGWIANTFSSRWGACSRRASP